MGCPPALLAPGGHWVKDMKLLPPLHWTCEKKSWLRCPFFPSYTVSSGNTISKWSSPMMTSMTSSEEFYHLRRKFVIWRGKTGYKVIRKVGSKNAWVGNHTQFWVSNFISVPQIDSDCISSLQRRQLKMNPTGEISLAGIIALDEIVLVSRSVVSGSLQPHGPQHSRPPCPSPTPGPCSDSCPLSQWCHPTISSCRPLLLLPSIFPSIRVSSNKSVLHIRSPKSWSFSFNISPSNEYSGFPLGLIGWISL